VASLRHPPATLVGLVVLFASNASCDAVATDFKATSPQRSRNIAGLWLDADRPAQGLMMEQIDSPSGAPGGGFSRVVVSWYTWAPAADPAPGPRWLFGIGQRNGSTIVVDPVFIAREGRFVSATGTPAGRLDPWGRLEIDILPQSGEVAGAATLSYSGPVSWGEGVRDLRQLTVVNFGIDYDLFLDPPVGNAFAPAGTYSSPINSGQGWVLNQYARLDDAVEGGVRVESILLWYTYDLAGKPTWLVGIDSGINFPGPTFHLLRALSGGTFEGGVPQLEPWGTLHHASDRLADQIACEASGWAWQAEASGFGSGHVAVARLTRPYEENAVDVDHCIVRTP
jgi:hypothetical protein